VQDDVNLRFHDVVALEEIELYAEVLSAVAAADGPLTTEEIDEVLGLRERARADTRVCLQTTKGQAGPPGAPPPPSENITSVPEWAKPIDSYSLMAATFSSST
jgi:hypothetical protein